MKRYNLILADPPWLFQNWSADAPGMTHNRSRGAAKHYPCMPLDQIRALRPPAADDAVLLIWTFGSHLEKTLQVIHSWGFTYKTKAWTWIKTNGDGKPMMGMGYWTRQCTEDCLLATRGDLPAPLYRSELGLINAPCGRHSEKPDEQYAKIDRLFPPELYSNRLEMFARKQMPGWDVFGNEVEGSIAIAPSPIQARMF